MYSSFFRTRLQKKYLLSLIFSMFFLLAPQVDAATLSLSPGSTSVVSGNIVSIRVQVNSSGTYINNAEAAIQFPTDLLEVVSVSKSSSVFSLWVEEPTFSNNQGRVVFNGGVANPGYNGSNGSIISITFRAKKAGTASLIFADSAVRANDGLGTNVLSGSSGSTILITNPSEVVPIPPDPNVPTPEKSNTALPNPVINSSTHPNPDVWYSNNTASFSWKIPNNVTSVQATLTTNPTAAPTMSYDSSVTQKTLKNVSDGVYYFHLRYSNLSSVSKISHQRVNIDTTAPGEFTPTVRLENGQNIITLDALDATSGVDHYTLVIEGGQSIDVLKSELLNKEYTLPVLPTGTYTLLVSAYDKAGNKRDANLSFTSPIITSPVLSLNTQEITQGDSIIIFGQSDYPNQNVEITLGIGTKEIQKYVQKTAQDGSFSVTTDRIKTAGSVHISARNVFSDTVSGPFSPNIYLKVNETEVSRVSRVALQIIGAAILLSTLLILLFVGWYRFFAFRKKIAVELQSTVTEAHTRTLLLKDELSKQLKVLEKIKVDRNLNKKEELIFKSIQKSIEDLDDFIEKKLKKLL
jgi:hypothetical protein